MFFLLYKRADDAVFDDFPKISTPFRRFFKIGSKAWRTFPNISEQDYRRLPKATEDVSIIHQQILM